MSIIDAVILGVIQGFSEFLPISSTAHLTLAGRAMGLIGPETFSEWTATLAIIQLGTVLSVLVYFRKEISSMISAVSSDLIHLRRARHEGFHADSRLAFLIAVGTMPIVILGFLLSDIIEGSLTKDTGVIAWSLIILAVVLMVAELTGKRQRELGSKKLSDAILIGCAQALALVPGASRSGTTITAGLVLGFTREAAARFSFLLSIPAVVASSVFEMISVSHELNPEAALPLAISVVVSGATGYFAIAFLIHFLRTHSTFVFIIYRILLGTTLLLWL